MTPVFLKIDGKPKVSVITVCLNCRKTIPKTLESIFSQNYENLEIIVVDGKSHDGTVSYLQSLGHRFAAFISEPDSGIYDAMNKGVKVATGDFIIFLNAGDRFAAPDVISQVFSHGLVVGSELPPIITGRIQFEHNGKPLNLFRPKNSGKEGLGLPHQATFVSSSLHKKYLFDTRYRFVGDYELWRRLQSKGLFSVAYLDIIVSRFSVGGASTDTRNDMKRYLERAYVDYLYSNQFGFREWGKIGVKVLIRKLISLVCGGRLFITLLRVGKKMKSC